MIVDTHAHLADPQFDADRASVLVSAREAGVGVVVEIADNEDQWAPARALAEENPGRVFWTAGFHPYYAEGADKGLADRLKNVLSHPALVGVGEIGLDYHRDSVSRTAQRNVFAELLAAAAEADKPVVIHCREAGRDRREAQDDMLAVFREVLKGRSSPHPTGVLHCFQGTLDFAEACFEMDFLVGVDGPVTYPGAESLRRVLAGIPLERMVLETDCPYLPPQAWRGRRNQPSYLRAVAEGLAALKNVPLPELETQTTRNAERLYRRDFLP